MPIQDIEFRNGIKTVTIIEDGKRIVKKSQDIEHDVNYATQLRNADEYTRNGIKAGFWHAAHIPDVVIADLYSKGINVFTAPAKDIVSGLKKYGYDYLLTTTKRIA